MMLVIFSFFVNLDDVPYEILPGFAAEYEDQFNAFNQI